MLERGKMQLKQLAEDFSITPLTDMSILKSKEYVEKQALMTLHYACGFRLDEWKCNDRPDLQNLSEHRGIEVVQDCYPDEWEATRHIEKVWGASDVRGGGQKLDSISQGGGSIVRNGRKNRWGVIPNSPRHPGASACNHPRKISKAQFRRLSRVS